MKRFTVWLMKAALFIIFLCTAGLFVPNLLHAQPLESQVEFAISEKGKLGVIPCRIHLKDSDGKARFAGGLPKWRDHFVCKGKVEMGLPEGTYSYEIERGPEYSAATGTFTVIQKKRKSVSVALERLASLASEGWWSGDLHVHRPVKDIELLMQAEDLHVAPVMTWWNKQNLWSTQPAPSKLLNRFDRNRYYHVMGGEDEREGGALLYFNLNEPLAISAASREYPSPMKFVEQARLHSGVSIDIEKPFWWDVPIWIASGQADSIGIANNHMCREQMYESEAWGKPRDARRLPAPKGNGFWTQEIYYHLLNCGLRLPPSAGSASGVLPNPVGYNRVYVHVGKQLAYDQWWAGLRAGRSFVSNGPLLRCRVNGELPGQVFTATPAHPLKLQVIAELSSRDPISAIEIIKNGQVDRAVSHEALKRAHGLLGEVTFHETGWFLVRAMTDNPKTFRFASTAPYYVEIGKDTRRISKASSQFFLSWVRERSQRVKLTERNEREEVLQHHKMAEKYWSDLASRANYE
jgi:hypothetical protein